MSTTAAGVTYYSAPELAGMLDVPLEVAGKVISLLGKRHTEVALLYWKYR